MIAAFLTFAAAVVLAASPDGPSAFPPSTGPNGVMLPSWDAFNLEYQGRAKALQAEMLALQKSDGGELSAKHRADLQEKLEALLSTYQRNLQRVDPMSVNADGSPVR